MGDKDGCSYLVEVEMLLLLIAWFWKAYFSAWLLKLDLLLCIVKCNIVRNRSAINQRYVLLYWSITA